jgi:hypothetical protein
MLRHDLADGPCCSAAHGGLKARSHRQASRRPQRSQADRETKDREGKITSHAHKHPNMFPLHGAGPRQVTARQ